MANDVSLLCLQNCWEKNSSCIYKKLLQRKTHYAALLLGMLYHAYDNKFHKIWTSEMNRHLHSWSTLLETPKHLLIHAII